LPSHRPFVAQQFLLRHFFSSLPRKRRDGLAASYAFMRLVDHVADENNDVSAKQRGLAKGAPRSTKL